MYTTKQKGFTIVELLIVIVVIAILAAISIVAFTGIQQRGRDAARASDVNGIIKAITTYVSDNHDWPKDGDEAREALKGYTTVDLGDEVIDKIYKHNQESYPDRSKDRYQYKVCESSSGIKTGAKIEYDKESPAKEKVTVETGVCS